MRTKHAFRPRVEALEDRWVPATVKVVSGILLISNQSSATLTIEPQAPGVVKVTDGAAVVTVSGAGGMIQVTGTTKADTIILNTTTAPYAGNVLINSGNGADAIKITSPGPAGIGGNLTVLGGLGDDTFSFEGGSRVGGTLNFVGDLGSNDFKFNSHNIQIGGDLLMSGANDITTGAGNTISVGGTANLVASSTTSVPITLTGAGAITVGKALQVTGFAGADNIAPTGILTVGGNTSLNLGNGNDTVDLTVAATSSLNGSLSVLSGSGANSVTFGDNLTVAGNAGITLGDGVNTLVLDNKFSIFGDFNITLGNGANTAFTVGDVTGGGISGSLNMRLGNGGNTATVVATVGGKLSWRSGNGGDSLTLGDGATDLSYVVDVVFGSGDDSFTMDLVNGNLTGIVDGGGRVTANSFTQTSGNITANTTIANFP